MMTEASSSSSTTDAAQSNAQEEEQIARVEVFLPPPRQSWLPVVRQNLFLQWWDNVKPNITIE